MSTPDPWAKARGNCEHEAPGSGITCAACQRRARTPDDSALRDREMTATKGERVNWEGFHWTVGGIPVEAAPLVLAVAQAAADFRRAEGQGLSFPVRKDAWGRLEDALVLLETAAPAWREWA